VYSKILLDDYSLSPGLKFETYALALRDIIELSEPQFSVGIFGGWGSGKTTLMRKIENLLDEKVVSVWFNAWRYEKEEHLIIPLLDTLRDALVTWADDHADDPEVDSSIKTGAIRAASTIAKAARAIFVGLSVKATLPLVEVSLDANKAVAEWRQSDPAADKKDAESPQSAYHASFKALQDSLAEFTQKGKQRIVVFIDDLDRCLPPNALQVLESMKLFFDLKGFVFVVGLDQKVIEASINWTYRFSGSSAAPAPAPPVSGADYIKKLFQVPFSLPAVSASQLDDYVKAIFPAGEEKDAEQSALLEQVRPHLDALAEGGEMNPREIKRYINAYILQKLIQPDDLDDDVTLVLQTIAFRPDWSAAYQVFRSKPDAFTDAAKRQLGGEDGALRALDADLEGLPQSFFDYIKSKGGHKLLNLDPGRLAEQVRNVEATSGPDDQFAYIGSRLARLAQSLDADDPVEMASAPGSFDDYRASIKTQDGRLRELFAESSSRFSRGDESTLHSITETMSSVKNEADRLVFTLRRGAEMGSDDFADLLERRSQIAHLLRQAEQMLRALSRPSGLR
jgi:hypothetical protein